MPTPETARSLTEAIAAFDRASIKDYVARAEAERAQILEAFPLAGWPTMPLSRYALGQNTGENTYCWWIEFGSPHLGSISGGTSRKLVIYKHKNREGWFYPKQFDDEKTAWIALRDAFTKALGYAASGAWESIDEMSGVDIGPALLVKTLHVYFPHDVLSVYSRTHILHFLRALGRPEADDASWDVIRLNRALLETLRAMPALKDWRTNELEKLLYAWNSPQSARRILKVSPGENGRFWDECLAGGYICVGWDEVGDLREFESKDAFRARFDSLYRATAYNDHAATSSRKANEVWSLLELEPGDIVVANKGISHVLAIGEVVDAGYEWRADRREYKHCVRVKWDTSYATEIPGQRNWAVTTVAPVSAAVWDAITKGKKSGPNPPPAPPVDPRFGDMSAALERKGQLILYGPPGTGKTYHATEFIKWFSARGGAGITRPSAVAADSRRHTPRMWWVTANPERWSWDELFKSGEVDYDHGRVQRNFEVIRPGDLVVGYESTPVKRLVALARVTRGYDPSTNPEVGFRIEPIAYIKQGPTREELEDDAVIAASEPIRLNCQGTLFALTESEAARVMELVRRRDPSLRVPEAVSTPYVTTLTFHASYSYEDFIEGFRPVADARGGLSLRLEDGVFKRVCKAAAADPTHDYVVLIDEINRANVAKVFGEVITLLERDKRGLEITLPQSKEPFRVPPNVFVIGTMNTADRSIKLLDAALRRRFAFIEAMPDPQLLAGHRAGELAVDEFLQLLNERIVERFGREKQIGHAFLMEGDKPVIAPEEFCRRLVQEVLPLLQEYCYDDPELLGALLGAHVVDPETHELSDALLGDPDGLLSALAKEFTPPRAVLA